MKKKDSSHYMTIVKIGPKGQIVIPKEIRDMFDLEIGESLLIMADKKRGIGLQKQTILENFAKAFFKGEPTDYPVEEGSDVFAGAIQETMDKGSAER